MITIQNQYLTATFNCIGAELKSLVMDGVDYIWKGDPSIWKSSCPLLFPICGALKEDTYHYQGKAYSIPKHGFVRNRPFEVEQVASDRVVFLHRADEQTRQMYPFEYTLRVIYTLEEKTLHISYQVENLGADTMYFSIGSHEAYYTPEGVEDYDVLFPEKETLDSYLLCGTLVTDHKIPVIREQNFLPLYDKYFLLDTLVFKDLRSRSATLRNRKTGKAVRVDFPNARYFMLWHNVSAPYLCMEPWNGICDVLGSSYALEEKEGIQTLAAGEQYRNTHSITIVDAGV